MYVTSLAAALIGAQAGRLQLAAAIRMLKLSADSEAGVLKLLDAGQSNAAQLATAGLAPGVGQNLDTTT
jgi:hypothetical protein